MTIGYGFGNLVGKKWSKDEIEKLISFYPSTSAYEMAKVIGRSVDSIENKAKRLALKKAEDYKLKKGVESGRRSAFVRGDKVWSDSEREKFVQMYPVTPNDRLAQFFGCTVKAIVGQAWLLHLRKDELTLSRIRKETIKEKRPDLWLWTEGELEKLRVMYMRGDPLHTIASDLGRSISAIRFRLQKAGLKRSNPYLTVKLGKEGEEIAEVFFREHNWKIIKKGGILENGAPTAFDFIVETDKGESYALNVKHGKAMIFNSRNLKNLRQLQYPIALLYITPDREFFFLPVLNITDNVR